MHRWVQNANVENNKKVTRCKQLFVVLYWLIKSYVSDEHISTFNGFLKVVDHIRRKFVRRHHLASLVLICFKQFQLPKHRFKQRQNTPFCVFAFNMFSSFSTSRIDRSKCARMHLLVSLVAKLSQQCQLWYIGLCFR